MNIPQIYIRYGKLIDPFFKDSVSINYPDYEFPTVDEIKDKVQLFRKTFEDNKDVFFVMLKDLGLEFKRNTIDCFIVSATPRDMSAPLIIRSRYNETEFMDVMYHELLHKLFTDNEIPKYEYTDEISSTTINHIDIFAILKYFYLEFLKDEDRFQKIKEKSADLKNIQYKKAWEIVDIVGYKEIMKSIKNEKKSLPENMTSSL